MGRTVAYALAVAVVAALAGSLLWVRYGPVQAEAIWAAYASAPGGGAVRIVYPLDGTLFPPEIVAPTFRWEDESTDATVWLVRVQFDGGTPPIQSLSCWRQWTPTPQDWELIKKSSVHREARVLVIGVKPGWSRKIVSAGAIVLRTASDEVGAPPVLPGSESALHRRRDGPLEDSLAVRLDLLAATAAGRADEPARLRQLPFVLAGWADAGDGRGIPETTK